MKTFLSNLNITILLLTLCLLACDDDDDGAAADLNMPVVVETIKFAPIAEFITTTGTLVPVHEDVVVTEVQGILHLINNNGSFFTAGTKVEKGHLLAEIDNPAYLLEVRLESQQLAMENAGRELKKQESLYAEGGVTEKELETARQSALDARLNYEAAEIKAQKVRLRAPITGFIANLQSNFDGIRVSTGFTLCKVVDYSTVFAQVNLPNSDMARIQIGQKVHVLNYALQEEVFEGNIVAIDPTIDPRTRTFVATVRVENQQLRLRPGMFVKTDIVVSEHPEALVIPKSALQTRDGRPVAFVVSGLSAELREVVTGIETKEDIEILSGLAEGERLVIRGQETLRDKSKVRVTE